MSGRKRHLDLGEAVSFDSVLTILTVLLVLRVVFMVPMVNLDKAKTESARRSGIWDTTISRAARLSAPGSAQGYLAAMGLSNGRVAQSADADSGLVWIEALLPDSAVAVVLHDRGAGTYVRLFAQSRTEHPSCQYGGLRWSPLEKQWFTVSDSVDYGDRGVSDATLARYRNWLASGRP